MCEDHVQRNPPWDSQRRKIILGWLQPPLGLLRCPDPWGEWLRLHGNNLPECDQVHLCWVLPREQPQVQKVSVFLFCCFSWLRQILITNLSMKKWIGKGITKWDWSSSFHEDYPWLMRLLRQVRFCISFSFFFLLRFSSSPPKSASTNNMILFDLILEGENLEIISMLQRLLHEKVKAPSPFSVLLNLLFISFFVSCFFVT